MRRHYQHFRAQVAAHFQGKLAVPYVAADVAGAADVDEVPDDHVALDGAVHLGRIGPDRAEHAAILVHQDVGRRDIALNVAVHLQLPAIVHLAHAADHGAFRDDEYALALGHCPCPDLR